MRTSAAARPTRPALAGALLGAAALLAGCAGPTPAQDALTDLVVDAPPDGPGALCEQRVPGTCEADGQCKLLGCVNECGQAFQLCTGLSGDCPFINRPCTMGRCEDITLGTACDATTITPEPGRSMRCVADYCTICATGAPVRTFVNCREESQPPYSCPDAPCEMTGDGECRDNLDCGGGQQCLAPGQSPGCGACVPTEPPCQSDTDCKGMGDNFICTVPECACMPQSTCVLGCGSDQDCPVGETCGKDGRCFPTPCKGAGDCPAELNCDNGRCTRPNCFTDGDCASGFCVRGFCHGRLGTCGPPVP